MDIKDNFSCLSKSLSEQLPLLKIETWASFATLDLERLVNIPEMTLEDLKVISKRLGVLGLTMTVEGAKFDAYYLAKENLTYNQILKLKFLETPVLDFFGWRQRISNGLERANVKTLRDLVCIDVYDLIKIPGIGKGSLIEIQNEMRKHGLRFGSKYPFD